MQAKYLVSLLVGLVGLETNKGIFLILIP